MVAEPSPGIYLCEFFDWFGTSDHQGLVRIDDMMEWTFYDDATWMSNAYEGGVRQRWERERGEAPEPGKLVSGGDFIHGAEVED
ncbi:hypothetical protein [Pseudonocardia sp. WMMC193]|uniref:hypothetical protein n=1 Tax=Pseudonocardia sp. WMMC193 TaxID=2911965 RepID=UPI001F31C065|nr:hypothetical protein [Pseudonocardia sp. WMMC193]MCF7552208.1 hypothetical protein [Pseudonocardia sp. WMMC193]